MKALHFLRLEWQKFSPNTTFRVLVVLYVVFFALATYLAFLIGRNFTFNNNGQIFRPANDLFAFPRSWEMVSYVGGWLNMILLGFLGVFMITLELNNRTLRQTIIAGLSRRDLFLSKFFALLAVSAVATIVFLVFGALIGMTESATYAITDAIPSAGMVARYFVQCLGYLMLGTLAGLFIRQNALATLTYVAYVLFVEWICYGILYLTLYKGLALAYVPKLLQFLPNQVQGNLTPRPVPQMLQEMAAGQTFFNGISVAETWIPALLYLGLFIFLFHERLRKADF